MLSRISTLILVLIAAIPLALAQEGDYQGLHYAAPPGWSSGLQDGQFILAPADMTEETAVVVVLSGAESLGGKSFQDWLRARMSSGINAQVKVLQSTPVESSTSGSLQVLSTARTIKDASGGVRLQMYYAISDGKNAATAMLLTSSETGMKKYMPAFQSLFGSMRFTAASPAPPPAGAPSAPGGFVDGIEDSPPAPAKPGATGTPASQLKPVPGGAARTFQNVIYTPPPGWSVQENAGGVAISPQDGLQGNETLSLVILPGKVAANLEQEFQTTWLEVCGMLNAQSMRSVNGGMYDLEGVARSTSGWDFLRGTGANAGYARVRPEVTKLVEFQRLNLSDAHWDVRGPFDAVFCRNVMIYFDKPTQTHVLARIAPLLAPGGRLYAGHSESFTHALDLVTPCGRTVYRATTPGMA